MSRCYRLSCCPCVVGHWCVRLWGWSCSRAVLVIYSITPKTWTGTSSLRQLTAIVPQKTRHVSSQVDTSFAGDKKRMFPAKKWAKENNCSFVDSDCTRNCFLHWLQVLPITHVPVSISPFGRLAISSAGAAFICVLFVCPWSQLIDVLRVFCLLIVFNRITPKSCLRFQSSFEARLRTPF